MATRPFPCTVTQVHRLVPATDASEQDLEHLLQEQRYMHLVRFWAGYIVAMRGWYGWYDLEEFMSNVIVDTPPGSMFDLLKDTEKYILSCCYHGRDLDSVDAMIRERINGHVELLEIYEIWQKDNLA